MLLLQCFPSQGIKYKIPDSDDNQVTTEENNSCTPLQMQSHIFFVPSGLKNTRKLDMTELKDTYRTTAAEQHSVTYLKPICHLV